MQPATGCSGTPRSGAEPHYRTSNEGGDARTLKYLGLRLLASIPVLLVASFAVFCLVAVSGDPLANLREQSGVSEATIQARAEALHLNDSLFQRYGYWISDAMRGNFGSALDGESVIDKLARSAGVTLRMVIVAAIVAVVLAIVVGVGSALREGSVIDHSATLTVFVCFSMPVFFLAGVLKDVAIRVNEATGYRIFATVGERGVDDIVGLLRDRRGPGESPDPPNGDLGPRHIRRLEPLSAFQHAGSAGC